MTRRVCIRCGTLQESVAGKPCGACGASSFSLVPVANEPQALEAIPVRSRAVRGSGHGDLPEQAREPITPTGASYLIPSTSPRTAEGRSGLR